MKTFATFALIALSALPALPQATTPTDLMPNVTFRAQLSPSNETPPISGVNIFGDGIFSAALTYSAPGSLSQAVVDFRVQYTTEVAGTFTAMHIHKGAAGVSGPVVIDSMFGAPLSVAVGQGNIFRSNVITDPTTLAVIQDLMAHPRGYYLNLHSTTYPAGIIRGQLQGDVNTQLDRMEGMLRAIGKVLGLVFESNQPPAPDQQ
jgi:hypothetical protein